MKTVTAWPEHWPLSADDWMDAVGKGGTVGQMRANAAPIYERKNAVQKKFDAVNARDKLLALNLIEEVAPLYYSPKKRKAEADPERHSEEQLVAAIKAELIEWAGIEPEEADAFMDRAKKRAVGNSLGKPTPIPAAVEPPQDRPRFQPEAISALRMKLPDNAEEAIGRYDLRTLCIFNLGAGIAEEEYDAENSELMRALGVTAFRDQAGRLRVFYARQANDTRRPKAERDAEMARKMAAAEAERKRIYARDPVREAQQDKEDEEFRVKFRETVKRVLAEDNEDTREEHEEEIIDY